ncbi:pseudaminic acid cytidylyltransferase [Chitinophaga sp. Mgbs1]|uniref:Pseudaminic acid cytidylyltransferase n=1 Tax=Chitinophaga solisilvae TaxID=1233460 RepID=A0A3S1CQ24_9BACT|nr:pseudaminic acid cytidylyltransferase [Chitinophaga solisilvae]
MKQNVAIIPARGGSKRIPRKNIKPFMDKPIIAFSIEAALNTGLFSEVMVSTDDEEIAEVAISYGAKVPFKRTAENANDFATTADVLLEVLAQYKELGKSFENACCIYPCAPFISADKLKQSYETLVRDGYDTVFPVMKFHYPIQRALCMRNGLVSMFQPEHLKTRSQDLEPAYCDAGQYYWFNISTFLQKKQIWTDNTSAIVISELEGHDIDSLEDWRIAEIKYRILANIL